MSRRQELLEYFEDEIKMYTGIKITQAKEDFGFYCFTCMRLEADQLISLGTYIKNCLGKRAIVNARHGMLSILVRTTTLEDIYKELMKDEKRLLLGPAPTLFDTEMTINAT